MSHPLINCCKIPFYYFCFLLLSLSACQQNNPAEHQRAQLFSSKDYFQQEIGQLKQNHVVLHKTIQKGVVLDSIDISTPKWETELQPFIESDINKPSLRDSYSVDYLIKNGTKTLNYKAIEKHATIQLLQIEQDENGHVIRIHIHSLEQTNLYKIEKDLSYDPHIGYTIVGLQKIPTQEPLHYRISGTFKK